MADQEKPGQLAGLIAEAAEGRLNLRMSPEEFARIDRECAHFVDHVIADVQSEMKYVAGINLWGFGDHPDSLLTSAPAMAERFRKKAMGQEDGNSFATVLTENAHAVEEIRQLFAAMRDRYIEQDRHFADRFHTEAARIDKLPK
ncbi:hypothetical protein D5S18_10165 [Nocardia panacis]|uniref:Uncharacterized protein n=1 Tax=Nocardia panacis TaxID=2340916 RepID=A0A3A4KPY7_9NOCA|nr:hypothetical protein [Nocardia panacis]RJO76632.1 hypothetical protein D5S18_10165 [Nocardia panacis]